MKRDKLVHLGLLPHSSVASPLGNEMPAALRGPFQTLTHAVDLSAFPFFLNLEMLFLPAGLSPPEPLPASMSISRTQDAAFSSGSLGLAFCLAWEPPGRPTFGDSEMVSRSHFLDGPTVLPTPSGRLEISLQSAMDLRPRVGCDRLRRGPQPGGAGSVRQPGCTFLG